MFPLETIFPRVCSQRAKKLSASGRSEPMATHQVLRSPMKSFAARSALEGILERTLGRRRASGGLYHVKEGTQSGRDLPAPGKIDKISIERGRPILQHPDQLTRTYERFGQSFERECDAQPVERRATGQIRIAERNPAIHRNSQ